MSGPVKHAKKCLKSFPGCPCNTCAKDVVDDAGGVCCKAKRKKCEVPDCPEYEKEVTAV